MISSKGALLALTAALAAQPAAAQDEKKQSVEEVAKDAAVTPLEDIGVVSEDIPQALIIAARDPYADEGLTTCNAIVGEVASLDTVLGKDYDIAEKKEGGLSVDKAAKSVVGSIIPFRGIVREVSGAAGDQRKAQAAVMAGMVRRGYLKGLGKGRGCKYPARPK